MAAREPLRAVKPGERRPSRPRAKSVTQAAARGTTRELLVAIRTRVAKAVEDADTPARDLAALTKRLVDVAHDIEAIDAREQQEASKSGPTADETWSAI